MGPFLGREMGFQSGEGLLLAHTARQPPRTAAAGVLCTQAHFCLPPHPPLLCPAPSSVFSQSGYFQGICRVLTFPCNVSVAQESMSVHPCECVSVYACTGHSAQIKLLLYCISHPSSVCSSALSHLNKTSICNNPINRKPY